jgi:hypothetical protein
MFISCTVFSLLLLPSSPSYQLYLPLQISTRQQQARSPHLRRHHHLVVERTSIAGYVGGVYCGDVTWPRRFSMVFRVSCCSPPTIVFNHGSAKARSCVLVAQKLLYTLSCLLQLTIYSTSHADGTHERLHIVKVRAEMLLGSLTKKHSQTAAPLHFTCFAEHENGIDLHLPTRGNDTQEQKEKATCQRLFGRINLNRGMHFCNPGARIRHPSSH